MAWPTARVVTATTHDWESGPEILGNSNLVFRSIHLPWWRTIIYTDYLCCPRHTDFDGASSDFTIPSLNKTYFSLNPAEKIFESHLIYHLWNKLYIHHQLKHTYKNRRKRIKSKIYRRFSKDKEEYIGLVWLLFGMERMKNKLGWPWPAFPWAKPKRGHGF